jgi:hypothetical protein
MRDTSKPIGYIEAYPGIVLVYSLILLWEQVSMPGTSHQGSLRGLTWSLLALPTGAFVLAHIPGSSSRFFVYGVVGSLLFVPRFLNIDRFSLWLEYVAPPPHILMIYWVLFALGIGSTCWLAAKFRNLLQPEACKSETPA